MSGQQGIKICGSATLSWLGNVQIQNIETEMYTMGNLIKYEIFHEHIWRK